MKRYDNGELVIKTRIQDEVWSPDYSCFLERLYMYGYHAEGFAPDVQDIYDYFEKIYLELYEQEHKINHERLLRWCVLHKERMENMPTIEELKEKYGEL